MNCDRCDSRVAEYHLEDRVWPNRTMCVCVVCLREIWIFEKLTGKCI